MMDMALQASVSAVTIREPVWSARCWAATFAIENSGRPGVSKRMCWLTSGSPAFRSRHLAPPE